MKYKCQKMKKKIFPFPWLWFSFLWITYSFISEFIFFQHESPLRSLSLPNFLSSSSSRSALETPLSHPPSAEPHPYQPCKRGGAVCVCVYVWAACLYGVRGLVCVCVWLPSAHTHTLCISVWINVHRASQQACVYNPNHIPSLLLFPAPSLSPFSSLWFGLLRAVVTSRAEKLPVISGVDSSRGPVNCFVLTPCQSWDPRVNPKICSQVRPLLPAPAKHPRCLPPSWGSACGLNG